MFSMFSPWPKVCFGFRPLVSLSLNVLQDKTIQNKSFVVDLKIFSFLNFISTDTCTSVFMSQTFIQAKKNCIQSGGDPVQTACRAQFHSQAPAILLRRWNVSQLTVLDRWIRLLCCPSSRLLLYHCHHSTSLSCFPPSTLSSSYLPKTSSSFPLVCSF